MTIQEAMQSGKYFHRPKHGEHVFKIKNKWLWYGIIDYSEEDEAYMFYVPEYTGFENLNAEDILADDWELVK